jgi:hypothetical protein
MAGVRAEDRNRALLFSASPVETGPVRRRMVVAPTIRIARRSEHLERLFPPAGINDRQS